MNMEKFICLIFVIYSFILFIIYYFVYYKKRNYSKECLIKTNGKIINYSKVLYNNISLPIVEYIVNGEKFTVVGPKFRASTFKYSTKYNKEIYISNLTDRENLPNVLKVVINPNLYVENSISSYKSPLSELYPINSEVDVYYNPNNPKMAYVQRYINPSKLWNILLIIAILTFIVSMIFLLN